MTNTIDLRVTMQGNIFGPTSEGYRIVSTEDERGNKVVIGGKAIPSAVDEGDELIVSGFWKHSDRGTMLVATKAHRALPQTEKGLRLWLEKAKIPGIGKIRAEKLVDAFGLKTIEKMLDADPAAVKIVGPAAHKKATQALKERKQEIEIGTMLSAYGIGSAIQSKLQTVYGERLHNVLKENPYEIIRAVKGIAFNTADKIAQSTGIDTKDPQRIKAGIVDQLRYISSEGSTAVYYNKLISGASAKLNVDDKLIEKGIEDLKKLGSIKFIDIKGEKACITRKFDELEEQIALNIARKLKEKNPFSKKEIEEIVAKSEELLKVNLNEKQREAAITSLLNPIAILTGGPGTGKTRTLEIILAAWKQLSNKKRHMLDSAVIALAAPTGKAANRATEVTGIEGKTIHRLLEYNPSDNTFEKGKTNPIEAGFIAIDEFSMPDTRIVKDLSDAWGKSKILLIGDDDQLPSVGAGKILSDMIASKKIPTIQLTEIYRQSAGSAIALGAAEVKVGNTPKTQKPGKGELVFIDIDDPYDVAMRIKEMFVDKMPKYLAKNKLDTNSIQILSPGKQGEVGTLNLNRIIQQTIHGENPKGPQIGLSDGMIGRVMDKVIQLENDYHKNIFNGDTGKIIEIETNSQGIATETHVDFNNRIVSFTGAQVPSLTLSYALTVHKSQGSEFQVVIIPVTGTHYNLNKRPLIYTGMTRAKKICVFVGTRKALAQAIKKEDASNRTTTLQQRLEALC